MNKKIVIIGASGHGKVIADIAKKTGYTDIVFLDDNTAIKECGGYTVAGTSKDVDKYNDSEFIVAIGNAKIRQKIQTELLEKRLRIATLIHPNAVIAERVTIGVGTVIMAGAVINPDTTIGEGCIINTCASVDHDCVLGDYVHIAVGAHVAGTVHVGENSWIGAGAVLSNNITLTSDVVIGAGGVVIKDILKPGTYVGVPVKRLK